MTKITKLVVGFKVYTLKKIIFSQNQLNNGNTYTKASLNSCKSG